MWMTEYMLYVKRGLHDQHNIQPTGGTESEPLFEMIPDGIYPMTIDGKLDYVIFKDQRISCCNYDGWYTVECFDGKKMLRYFLDQVSYRCPPPDPMTRETYSRESWETIHTYLNVGPVSQYNGSSSFKSVSCVRY